MRHVVANTFRYRKSKRVILGVVIAVITAYLMVFFLTGNSPADGSRKCQFEGIAELDGAAVNDGTVITAMIEGDEYYSTTPTIFGTSDYCLTIEPPAGQEYPEGTEVIFKIDNRTVEQTGTFKAGAVIGLDLTTYAPPAPGGLNMWVTGAACVGLFICGGIICFLLYLDRILRKLWTPVEGSLKPSNSSTLIIELYLE
jgi:hypothetical protein